MEKIVLEAELRDSKIAPSYLRKTNKVPAVYYGNNQKNLHLQLDYQSFRKAYMKAGGNQIIELVVGKQKQPVLVHDIQVNPITDMFEHVDFLHVNMNEEITAMIPIEVVGIAPAVKDLGGILTTLKSEIEVRCLPTHLPPFIQVDISGLAEIHSSIHVSDLQVAKEVEILDTPEEVVVTISAPAKEEPVEAQVPAEEAAPAGEQGEAGKGEEAPKES